MGWNPSKRLHQKLTRRAPFIHNLVRSHCGPRPQRLRKSTRNNCVPLPRISFVLLPRRHGWTQWIIHHQRNDSLNNLQYGCICGTNPNRPDAKNIHSEHRKKTLCSCFGSNPSILLKFQFVSFFRWKRTDAHIVSSLKLIVASIIVYLVVRRKTKVRCRKSEMFSILYCIDVNRECMYRGWVGLALCHHVLSSRLFSFSAVWPTQNAMPHFNLLATSLFIHRTDHWGI